MLHVENMPSRIFALRKSGTLVLALVWFLGLASGIFFSNTAGDSITTLMRLAVHSHVTIVGLAAITVFPLVLSALAVHISVPLLIFLIAFFKAFIQGLFLVHIYAAFGDAGWLVRSLYMFADSCMSIILLRFWIRHLIGSIASLKHDFIICFVAALLICTVDYFLVSPYLMMLTSF